MNDVEKPHQHELHCRESEVGEILAQIHDAKSQMEEAGIDWHPVEVIGHDGVDHLVPSGGAYFIACWMDVTWDQYVAKKNAENN